MSKILGFLLGIAVALVGPAMFGVLAADGGIELNAKEMALAYGIGALIFWAVVSYFSGAAALGAALTFGAMIYTVHWIPNRTTNFLNDVPGVTTRMIDGIKQYTLNGVVPILAVISLVFGIQQIVRAVQRRRRERAEAARRQAEQDAAQQQEMDSAAAYPVGGGEYQPDSRFANNFGNTSYDDLFDEEPRAVPPRSQADEQTAQFAQSPVAEVEEDRDETVLVPTDRDETVMVPTGDGSGDRDGDQSRGEPADEAIDRSDDATQADEDTRLTPEASDDDSRPVGDDARLAGDDAEPVAGGADEGGRPGRDGADDGTARSEAEAAGEKTVIAGAGDEDEQEAVAPKPAGGATQAPQASAPGNPGPATAVTPAAGPVPGVQQAPVVKPDLPQAPAPQPDAQQTHQSPAAPQAAAPQTEASQTAEPQAIAPQAAAAQAASPAAVAPQAVASQSAPAQTAAQAVAPRRVEEVGQQYRERMDPPDVDDTGEFHLGAFESPGRGDEHTAPMMGLRPAGA
ncbi:hypothetical protein GCM10009789_40630 [Kribbella sancticallisti]|uniref:Uncharacterized protein n=1 Tax=Kribbella sancticallisti TaxID=460087 RepID=A0ABN2DPU3_9ACTN